jgi:hypothetical protein
MSLNLHTKLPPECHDGTACNKGDFMMTAPFEVPEEVEQLFSALNIYLRAADSEQSQWLCGKFQDRIEITSTTHDRDLDKSRIYQLDKELNRFGLQTGLAWPKNLTIRYEGQQNLPAATEQLKEAAIELQMGCIDKNIAELTTRMNTLMDRCALGTEKRALINDSIAQKLHEVADRLEQPHSPPTKELKAIYQSRIKDAAVNEIVE